jgi:hypothetical protein
MGVYLRIVIIKLLELVNFETSAQCYRTEAFIHKYTWTSSDGKTHNQIDRILIYRRGHSSILDVQPFRGADCDSDHCVVVAEVRERLAVNKERAQKYDVEIFNLRKLSDPEVRKQNQKIANGFAGLMNLNDSEDISRVWKTSKRISKPKLKRACEYVK